MASIVSTYVGVIRKLPLWSAIDLPLSLMEEKHLTDASIVFPNLDIKNEGKITQTAVRLFFAATLPTLAKPLGFANLGLGITHLVWCICNIKSIINNEKDYPELEKALIRITSGVYDLAIAYLLESFLMKAIPGGRYTVALFFGLWPPYLIQLHYLVFEKAVKPIVEAEKKEGETKKPEINHYDLSDACLIKEFCKGLTFMLLPPPKSEASLVDRVCAIPVGTLRWTKTTYTKVFGAAPPPTIPPAN